MDTATMGLNMGGLAAIVTPQLLNILAVLAILIIGLFLAKFIRSMLAKSLAKVSFLQVKTGEKTVDLVQPIVSLVYYVILLNVLLVVLGKLGLTNVLDPLKDMAAQFLGYLPKIIGAGIVVYVGWVLASIFSELAKAVMSKFDESVASKVGHETFQVSKLAGAVVFGTILLPIVVAALGILDIQAISVPATAMIEQLMAAVPKILAAGIIIGVTYAVTKFVIYMLSGLLDGLHVDTLPAKLGIANLFNDKFTLSKLITGTVFFFAMLASVVAAVDKLEIPMVSHVLAKVLEFGGSILVGGVILAVGNFLSLMAYNKLTSTGSTGLANVARIAILGLVLAMGLKTMGLADSIVNMAFGATIGSVAIAVAIAFGIGGRDAAKQIADKWAAKINK